jgi:hypothetical protein
VNLLRELILGNLAFFGVLVYFAGLPWWSWLALSGVGIAAGTLILGAAWVTEEIEHRLYVRRLERGRVRP